MSTNQPTWSLLHFRVYFGSPASEGIKLQPQPPTTTAALILFHSRPSSFSQQQCSECVRCPGRVRSGVSEGGAVNGSTPPQKSEKCWQGQAEPRSPRGHTPSQHDASRAHGHVWAKVGKKSEVAAADVCAFSSSQTIAHRSTGCFLPLR